MKRDQNFNANYQPPYNNINYMQNTSFAPQSNQLLNQLTMNNQNFMNNNYFNNNNANAYNNYYPASNNYYNNNYQNTNSNYPPNQYNQNRKNIFNPNTNDNSKKQGNFSFENQRNFGSNFKKQTAEENIENKEEIKLWVERRKSNYPSKLNIERKKLTEEQQKEEGEILSPMLSKLETKLRRKLRVINSQFDKTERLKSKCYNDLKYFINEINTCESIYKNYKVNNFDERREEIEHEKEGPDHNEREENEDGRSFGVQRKRIRKKGKEKKQNVVNNVKLIKEIGGNRPHTDNEEKIEEIIASLKQKQKEENDELDQFKNRRSYGGNYKYKANTLTANLLLEEIFKERSIILQTLRYIKKENFFFTNETSSCPSKPE